VFLAYFSVSFVAVLLAVVQPVLGVPIQGADTRIKDVALQPHRL
jgi:hypothetical protein